MVKNVRDQKGRENVFKEMGMMCLGCPASQAESLKDACDVHNISVDEVLNKLNK